MRIPESGDCNIGMCAYMFNCNGLIDDLEKHCIDNPNCQYKQLQRLKKKYDEVLNLAKQNTGGKNEQRN